jgi:hypothetical protein
VNDFAPITMVASTAILMALHPSVPADTVRGLIEAAKTRPQMIANYGSAGTGTVFHLTGELFKQLAGLQLQHVPYRGGAPTVSALLAGEIPLAFETMLVLQPHVRAGTLRALAVTSPAAQRYHARHPDHCGGRVPGVGCGQFVRPVCTLRNARPSGRDDAGATPSTTALPATFDEYDGMLKAHGSGSNGCRGGPRKPAPLASVYCTPMRHPLPAARIVCRYITASGALP